jgi:hypothetical protein
MKFAATFEIDFELEMSVATTTFVAEQIMGSETYQIGTELLGLVSGNGIKLGRPTAADQNMILLWGVPGFREWMMDAAAHIDPQG